MEVVTAAMIARMKGDATLTGLLAKYPADKAGAAPAVFSMRPVPGDAVLPYIVCPFALGIAPFDSKERRGRDVLREVFCYTRADGDSRTVEKIADRVHDLFHPPAGLLSVAGFVTVVMNASGPVGAPTSDREYGLLVTVRLLLTPP